MRVPSVTNLPQIPFLKTKLPPDPQIKKPKEWAQDLFQKNVTIPLV